MSAQGAFCEPTIICTLLNLRCLTVFQRIVHSIQTSIMATVEQEIATLIDVMSIARQGTVCNIYRLTSQPKVDPHDLVYQR